MKETHEELLMLEKRINKMLEFTKEYSAKDPDACMNKARQIGEGICLYTIIKNDITKPNNLPKTLEQMIQCLKPYREIMDATTLANVTVLQTWGNMGSHYNSAALTNKNISPALEALHNLVDWFFKENEWSDFKTEERTLMPANKSHNVILNGDVFSQNAQLYANEIQYRLSLSSDRGSLFLYSCESISKEKAKLYTVKNEEWKCISSVIGKIIAALHNADIDSVQITRFDEHKITKCAPIDGHTYYDNEFRINFGISYINVKPCEQYDSAHIEVDGTVSLSFYRKGKYIYHTLPLDTKLSDLGFHEPAFISLVKELLEVLHPNNTIMVANAFESKVYPDLSGGYKLRYLVKKHSHDSDNLNRSVSFVNGISEPTSGAKNLSAVAYDQGETVSMKKENTVNENYCRLIDELYQTLVSYRSAFQSANKMQINKTSSTLQEVIQQLFYIHERYQFNNPELAHTAYHIVMRYNAYVEKYRSFVSELNNGYSKKSNELARYAEEAFSDLVRLVVHSLSANVTRDCDNMK